MSDIVCTRVSAVRVDEAPEEALISLSLLDGAADITTRSGRVVQRGGFGGRGGSRGG